jgi:hypothetical protein
VELLLLNRQESTTQRMHQYIQSRKKSTPPTNFTLSLRQNNTNNTATGRMVGNISDLFIPHKDSLYRAESDDSHAPSYIIEIQVSPDDDAIDFMNDSSVATRELHFSNSDFTVVSRLFSILDTENINFVNRNVVKDFVYKRCPVFSRRDDDLKHLHLHTSIHTSINDHSSGLYNETEYTSTFDEIWMSVVGCSRDDSNAAKEATWFGIEGWMVFCRFIALTQYLEAKRRFSARHFQRYSPYVNEVVMVEVPPPEPPTKITPLQLIKYEERNENGLPLPELDLDHSLLAAHDLTTRRRSSFHGSRSAGEVRIALFGVSSDARSNHSGTSSNLEFAVTYKGRASNGLLVKQRDEGVVRRSLADMKWLDDTFTSHKVLGGTLCGRILPPFPASSSNNTGVLSTHFPCDESAFNTASIKNSTGGAITSAAMSVSRIRDAAKSLMNPFGLFMNGSPTDVRSDELLSHNAASSKNQLTTGMKKIARKKRHLNRALPESYYNPNSPAGKARQLERYLNYLLEHPALSTSFPLNAMLTVSLNCSISALGCGAIAYAYFNFFHVRRVSLVSKQRDKHLMNVFVCRRN